MWGRYSLKERPSETPSRTCEGHRHTRTHTRHRHPTPVLPVETTARPALLPPSSQHPVARTRAPPGCVATGAMPTGRASSPPPLPPSLPHPAELEELTLLVMEDLLKEVEDFDSAVQAEALDVMRRLEEEEEVGGV
jgi:hypothetical protein